MPKDCFGKSPAHWSLGSPEARLGKLVPSSAREMGSRLPPSHLPTPSAPSWPASSAGSIRRGGMSRIRTRLGWAPTMFTFFAITLPLLMKQIFNVPSPVDDAEDLDAVCQGPIQDQIFPKTANRPGPDPGQGRMVGFALASQAGKVCGVTQLFIQRLQKPICGFFTVSADENENAQSINFGFGPLDDSWHFSSFPRPAVSIPRGEWFPFFGASMEWPNRWPPLPVPIAPVFSRPVVFGPQHPLRRR